MKDNEYQCAMCQGIFELVNDDSWNDEKAKAEYEEKFPDGGNPSIVCDDCYKKMGLA